MAIKGLSKKLSMPSAGKGGEEPMFEIGEEEAAMSEEEMPMEEEGMEEAVAGPEALAKIPDEALIAEMKKRGLLEGEEEGAEMEVEMEG